MSLIEATDDPLTSVLNQMDGDDDFFDPPECLVPHFTADDLAASSRAADTESISSATSSSESKTRYLYPQLDTVEVLRPEEIRWFYKEPGDKKWTAFIGYDSLRIECKYREIQSRKLPEEVDSKVPEDEKCVDMERICVRGSLFEVDVTQRKCFPIYWSSIDQTAEVLRGTWFNPGNWQPLDEADAELIEKRHLEKFEHHKLPTTRVEQTKGILPVFTRLDLRDYYVEWNAIDQVSMHYHKTTSKMGRAFRSTFGFVKAGTKLQRGYYHEAKMDDKPPDITHLVFVVHGIGQKMEQGSIVKSCADLRHTSTRLISKHFKDCNRDNKRVEFLPCEWRSSLKLDGDIVDTITPRKIPGLRAMLNASAMDVMYYTSPLYRTEITHGLQNELNRLYTIFCARHPYFEASGGKTSIVAHSLGCMIVYDIITGWNPIQLYDQYVSHVIEETCQHDESAGELLAQLEKARQKVNDLESELLKLAERQLLKTPTLKFKLENFFCLGSPMAVFLALRGIRPKGNGTQDHILPRKLCSRLFNIFHPSDPVAYRLEPLILKHYSSIMPLRIHRHDAPERQAYNKMRRKAYHIPPEQLETKEVVFKDLENFTDAIKKAESNGERNNNTDGDSEKDVPQKLNSSFSSSRPSPSFDTSSEMDLLYSSSPKMSPNKRSPNKRVHNGKEPTGSDYEDTEETWLNVDVEGMEPTAEAATIDPENLPELDFRLDYMLKEGKMENSYVAALTSHTAYWTNNDVALFLLMQVYPEGPEEGE